MSPYFDYERAVNAQRELSKLAVESVRGASRLSAPSTVIGLDVSYAGPRAIGVAVAYDVPRGRVTKYCYSVKDVHVPYVPGLLAFREAPAMVSALRRLEIEPDVILVNGHGITHPRLFGIASHVGLLARRPSVGVARRPLRSGFERDSRGLLRLGDLVGGGVISWEGAELYVSAGYGIRAEDALELIRGLLRPGRGLPSPLYEADAISKSLRKSFEHGA